MFRIKIAAYILLALTVITLAGGLLLQSTCKELTDILSQAKQSADASNTASAKRKIVMAQEVYNKKEPLLALYIRRDFLNALAVNLSGLESYANRENINDLNCEIEKALESIEILNNLFFGLICSRRTSII